MAKKQKKFTPQQEFGKRLLQMRKSAGLTQLDLAKKINYKTNAAIAHFESGRNAPDLPILLKFSEIFSVDLHWLMLGRPSPDSVELIKRLRPYIEQHLQTMQDQIKSMTAKAAGIHVGHIFDEEEPGPEVRGIEKERDKLQADYNRITELIAKICRR
jgi:transcriptional regulator with XRE-family HTH domain